MEALDCLYILPCARHPGPRRGSVCEYCMAVWHSDSVGVREKKRFNFFMQSDNGLYKQPNDLERENPNISQGRVPLLLLIGLVTY
jgi:hypothetical protein